MELKLNLPEYSLSRLVNKMKSHDCGVITASKGKYTKKENQQRNKLLVSKLLRKGQGITIMKGAYIENFGTSDAKEVSETVYFVEDKNDTGNLKKDLIELGEEFDQDSILFIPKPGLNAILIGTNNSLFPGYHKEIKFSERSFGEPGEFMTKVKNRPFIFEEVLQDIRPDSYLSKQAVKAISEMDWQVVPV